MIDTPKIALIEAGRGDGDRAAARDWAAAQLGVALTERGAGVERDAEKAAPADQSVLYGSASNTNLGALLRSAGVTPPAGPEALALATIRQGGQPVTIAYGADDRGLVYALLELTERVRFGSDPLAALRFDDALIERPTNAIRSVTRLFVSKTEDLGWFLDRDFWRAYLRMLVTQRFNRFSLAFGIGFDFLRQVEDSYFLFPYPFLLDVPGYHVTASGVPAAERERNLAMVRFIGDEATRVGLDFQLGLWTHGYVWTDSPNANHVIEGLSPELHADYCRDALGALLDACPSVKGLTLRVHGESGVPEGSGSYSFWRTVFQGAVRCGRPIELDLHPKGLDRELLQIALDTGLPVRISPKYSAEHMGLPYQQAAIRELERESGPPAGEGDKFVASLMGRSGGDLRYTRYGYADFLTADRPYGVFYRLWPGTQRLLLWGDPAMAAAFGRAAAFQGSLGMEICEPLSFKGRRGSGLPGGRTAYADRSLEPDTDWRKYAYTYRLFGRLLYNPDADPEVWRRYLRAEFGAAAAPVEVALASASRILPLVTQAHHPSAANNRYWPEIYTNMPIVDPERPHPYRDTPPPRRFGTVSALDPDVFSTCDDFAAEVVAGAPSGRYSPLRVAKWLDDLAQHATAALRRADNAVGDAPTPSYRRLAIDVGIQAALGQFFADKLRAGVAYSLFLRTGAPRRLREALDAYTAARAAWVRTIALTESVYRHDITVGGEPFLRGHWRDRLLAIDDDLADMEAAWRRISADSNGRLAPSAEPALIALDQQRSEPTSEHTPPTSFVPGEPLHLALHFDAEANDFRVNLHYRRVNQAERYIVTAMTPEGRRFTATIPGPYTSSPYAVQYYFIVVGAGRVAWRSPGFEDRLDNQPYHVVNRSAAGR